MVPHQSNCPLYLFVNMMLFFSRSIKGISQSILLGKTHVQFLAFTAHPLERQQGFKNDSDLSFSLLSFSLNLFALTFLFILIFSCE